MYVYVCALPVVLLWETIEKVFGCESGIHINNLQHNTYETELKMSNERKRPVWWKKRSHDFNQMVPF